MMTKIMGWMIGAVIAGVLIVSVQHMNRELRAPTTEELAAVLVAADTDGDGLLTFREMQAAAESAPERVHRRAWQMVLDYPSDRLTSLSRYRRAEASALASSIQDALSSR